MKIRKRILSICLAVMLITALAIPASAYSFYDYGDYDGGTYEVSDVCHSSSYSSVMTYDGPEYSLRTDVYVYVTGTIDGYPAELELARIPGTPTVGINSNSGSFGVLLKHINCHHYINNTYLYSTTVNAS